MCWLNNTTNAHPDRSFNLNSGAWIYTTQSNLMNRQQHQTNYGAFHYHWPKRWSLKLNSE